MASTAVASNPIVLEVLNQHNYEEWKSRLMTYLKAEDLWDEIESPKRGVKNKASKIKNAKALHAIKISCGTEMFSFIQTSSTAKKAWIALERNFELGGDREKKGMQKLRDDREKKDDGCLKFHKAAMNQEVDTVKKLLSSMSKDDLKLTDGKGRTPLDVVIVASCKKPQPQWKQITESMVEKNPEIVKTSSLPNRYIPVVRACSRNNWEMARSLFSLTPSDVLQGIHGAKLINSCLWRPEGLDVAWNLLQQYPRLAMANSGSYRNAQPPMVVLAGLRSAFLSRERLTWWQRFIYKSIRIQPVKFTPLESHTTGSKSEEEPSPEKSSRADQGQQRSSGIPIQPESHITVLKSEDDDEPPPKERSGADQGERRNIFGSVMILFRRLVMEAYQLRGIKHVYEMKTNHFRFASFLSDMVKRIKSLDSITEDEFNVVRNSLFKATEQGHIEFVKHMYEAKRAVVDIFNEQKKSIFQYAIEHRQKEIYNFIYELEPEKREDLVHNVAKFQTNILHSAANLSPVTHYGHNQGPILQMQLELQWFKEVESLLPREMHEYHNTSNLTARELFIKNHKNLKNEAEMSMKEIAASCTTVGALIVTIMFAVAFTVPGATDGNTGLPIFLHNKLFRIFLISDTISLVSSATSVITFLGLLTSTYAEDDFLWSLPKKMMIGLSTLFISIAAMMITFSCAFTIMFDGEAKMMITSILFACVPVMSFVYFLFPLLYEICKSTYGPSMFHRKARKESKRWHQKLIPYINFLVPSSWLLLA